MPTLSEFAAQVVRALLSASSKKHGSVPIHNAWNPCLEEALHKVIVPRDSLNSALVSRVIDQPSLPPELALGFFQWATQQPNFVHNALTYHSIIKTLYVHRRYSNTIENLLKRVKFEGLILDGNTCRLALSSLLLGRKTQMAYCLFTECMTPLDAIGFELCNSLLVALAADGFMDDALKVFEEMLKQQVQLTTMGFGYFIWKFSRNVDLSRLMMLLEKLRSSCNDSKVNGSIVALLVVHGLCEGSRASEAMWVLNDLRIMGFKPDFIAYRVVVEALKSEGGSLDDVNSVLRMKRKLGVAPRSDDYKDVLLALIGDRRLNETMELAKIIVDGNFPLDDGVINAVIGSVSIVDPCSALMLFNYLLEKGKFPNMLTLSNLSKNLCKHRKYDELLDLFRSLSSNSFLHDLESYNVIFSKFCEAGRVREAYEVLQEAREKGFQPDIKMYNFLMESCCQEDMLRPARKLWDEMFATGCGVNLETFNILIRKFSEIGELEEAVMLFENMLDKRMEPDDSTYIFILEGLCEISKFETALEIFDRSVKQDAALARSLLRRFVLSLCVHGQFSLAADLICSLGDEVETAESRMALLREAHATQHGKSSCSSENLLPFNVNHVEN